MNLSVRLAGLMLLTTLMLAVFGTATDLRAATPLVKAGGNHTVALRTDGSLWAWGDNGFGQIGDGSQTARNTPVRIGTDSDWTMVAAGFYHTVALKQDGSLWVWGDNTKGQLGEGEGVVSRSAPVRIGSGTNWTAVAAGDFHTLALRADGSLWAWGDNSSGQVGNGTVVRGIQAVPLRIGTAGNWTTIAAGGSHSVARKTDNTLWVWGSNAAGQLGNGTTLDAVSPVQITLQQPFNNTDWSDVAAGQVHTAALKTDGSLWSWGSNASGQLGNGTALNSDVPVREAGNSTSWVAVAAGDSHSLGRKADGTLWSWGGNDIGQLGNGTNLGSPVPLKVGSATDWIATVAGSLHSVAMKANGTVWCWGDNSFGQLGDGTSNAKNSPVQALLPLPPATGATLTPDKSSPQVKSTVGGVTFNATGQGGSGSYEFEFWMHNGTSWSKVQNYSATSSFNWDTTTAIAGALYTFQVNVRSAGSTAAYEATQAVNYIVTAVLPASGAILTPDKPSPQVKSTVGGVTFNAAGQGGSGSYEFEFWMHNGTSWSMVRNYSAIASWNWDTTTATAGALYTFEVHVRNAGSTAAYEATQAVNYIVTAVLPATGATLTPDKASPQPQNTPGGVTFNATGLGGSGSYEFEFWMHNGTSWSKVQNYSTTSSLSWNTLTAIPGAVYTFEVHVRNAGSAAAYEATQAINYIVTAGPATGATLTPSKTSPQPLATVGTVVFTATGLGGSGSYEFEFWLHDGTSWSKQQNYSSTSTWNWDASTGSTGVVYTIQVNVRNAGSGDAFQSYQALNFILQ